MSFDALSVDGSRRRVPYTCLRMALQWGYGGRQACDGSGVKWKEPGFSGGCDVWEGTDNSLAREYMALSMISVFE